MRDYPQKGLQKLLTRVRRICVGNNSSRHECQVKVLLTPVLIVPASSTSRVFGVEIVRPNIYTAGSHCSLFFPRAVLVYPCRRRIDATLNQARASFYSPGAVG